MHSSQQTYGLALIHLAVMTGLLKPSGQAVLVHSVTMTCRWINIAARCTAWSEGCHPTAWCQGFVSKSTTGRCVRMFTHT